MTLSLIVDLIGGALFFGVVGLLLFKKPKGVARVARCPGQARLGRLGSPRFPREPALGLHAPLSFDIGRAKRAIQGRGADTEFGRDLPQ